MTSISKSCVDRGEVHIMTRITGYPGRSRGGREAGGRFLVLNLFSEDWRGVFKTFFKVIHPKVEEITP